MEADSSGYAAGGALLQKGISDGIWRPVAYYSRKHTPTESNYEIHDKELLAIMRCLEAWDAELRSVSKGFDIITDHKNIEYFMKKQRLNERQMQWSQELTRYDYRIKYRQGKEAVLPDTLSRRDQDMPRGTNDDRLQARFRQLIPETYACHSPTQPGSRIHRDDSNCSLPRQRVSQIFEKFADLGENHGSSRTLHVETTNLESRTGRQPSPSTTSPTTALTPPTHLESRVRGEDPDCLSPRQSVSQFSGKFADLGENHDGSRTLHVGVTNPGSHTSRQSLPVAMPPSAVTSSTAAELRVHGKDLECLPFRQRVSQIFGKSADLGEGYGSSQTLAVGVTNLEGRSNQQPPPPTTLSTTTALNPSGCGNTINAAAPFPEPSLRALWQAAVKEDLTYELLRNAIIRGDRRFPPDLHTPADIAQCTVLENFLYFRGALWIPYHEPLRTAILHKIHDSPIAGHPGRENTFALLTRDFYWPRSSQDYRRFVQNCETYARSQAWREQKKGLLKPLPIPQRIWQEISMDFMTDLPPSTKSGAKNIISDRGPVKQRGYFNSDVIDICPRGGHGLYRALRSVPRVPEGDC